MKKNKGKMIRFDTPVKLKKLKRKVRSNCIETIVNRGKLVPSYDDFGKGTCAGEIHCPKCHKALGHFYSS